MLDGIAPVDEVVAAIDARDVVTSEPHHGVTASTDQRAGRVAASARPAASDEDAARRLPHQAALYSRDREGSSGQLDRRAGRAFEVGLVPDNGVALTADVVAGNPDFVRGTGVDNEPARADVDRRLGEVVV